MAHLPRSPRLAVSLDVCTLLSPETRVYVFIAFTIVLLCLPDLARGCAGQAQQEVIAAAWENAGVDSATDLAFVEVSMSEHFCELSMF